MKVAIIGTVGMSLALGRMLAQAALDCDVLIINPCLHHNINLDYAEIKQQAELAPPELPTLQISRIIRACDIDTEPCRIVENKPFYDRFYRNPKKRWK